MLYINREIKNILDNIIENSIKKEKEFFAFSLTKKYDKIYIINEIFLSTMPTESYIAFVNQVEQMKFLKYCKVNEYIPTIIHSHVIYNNLKFSIKDEEFEKSLNNVQKKLWNKDGIISILFGKNEYVSRVLKDEMYSYIPIINIKEQVYKNNHLNKEK